MDAEYYTSLINIYIKHYNVSHNTKKTLFDALEMYDDCNEIMDTFFEHIQEFKESDESDKKIYSVQEVIVENFEQLYGLKINDDIVCVCGLLIPILDYVARKIDWTKVDWKIISMRN